MKSIIELKKGKIIKIECPVACACRLRAMGFCEGDEIENETDCDPIIIRSGQSRIAVCRSLAKYIIVEEEK